MSVHRFGGGLPKVGSRALLEGERAEVHATLTRAWAWLGSVLASVALASLAAYARPLGVPATSAFAVVTVGLTACAALVLGPVWLRAGVLVAVLAQAVMGLLALHMPEARPPHPALVIGVRAVIITLTASFAYGRVRDALGMLRRRAEVLEDVREGAVERCAGRIRDLTDAPTLQALRRRGDVLQDGPHHELEVLPRSGLVLRVDGRAPSRPMLAPIAAIASAAPHALRVALPDDLATIASPTVALQRRSLTPAERDELHRHARALRRPPWPLAVALPGTLAAAAWLWHHPLAEHPWWGALALGVTLAAGASLFHYVQSLRTASRLRADAQLRWLVTAVDRDAPKGASPDLEMLPVSRLAWNEHARPAPWRLERSR